MKKKRKSIIIFTVIILLIFILTKFINISNYRISAKKQTELMSSLNTITDVGQDVYVQHDQNNNDVYLLSSQGSLTTVYKILNVPPPEFGKKNPIISEKMPTTNPTIGPYIKAIALKNK